ncbi:MAG: hypothetical protein GXX90_08875 [Microbacteriaceae bacterium]|nr:hypothetical protein [Microbacteriaceae bacterium]
MTRARTGLDRIRRDDRGSVTPLIVVYAMIALATVLLLFAAADLHLARKQLLTLADGAALAAANRYDLDAVRLDGGGPVVALDHEQAALAAQHHLDRSGGGTRVVDLRLDGDRVVLRIAGEWRPPIASAFVPVSVPIEVEASGRGALE